MNAFARFRLRSSTKLAAVALALLMGAAPVGSVAAPVPPPAPASPPAPAVAPASPPAPAPKRWVAATPSKPPEDACKEEVSKDPVLAAALRDLTFERADGKKPLRDVQIVGLTTLDEKALWTAIGGRPATIDGAKAALLVRQLAALDIFATLTPVIDVRAENGPVLIINVAENPTVRKVVIEGLGELKPEALLKALLQAPSRKDVDKRARKRERNWEKWIESTQSDALRAVAEKAPKHDDDDNDDNDNDKEMGKCPDPLPVRDWLARSEESVVFPGIVWKGLQRGLERVMGVLFDRGYEMASLTADLAADGTLTLHIDEGRIKRFDIAGVEPAIDARVRELAGLKPGQPFVKSDLDDALARIRAAFPFLQTDSDKRPTRARPHVKAATPTGPGQRYETVEAPPERERRWYTVDAGALTLHFKVRHFEVKSSGGELIRHTPITGFAPGLEGSFWAFDAADRAHARVLAGANVNTKRAFAAVPGGADSEAWRFDWAAGGSLQIPFLRIAEIGALGYARVDTADRWRMHRVDSYVNSLFFNRPDAEYFRRSGVTGFVTLHVAQRITAGVEYRRDRYRSLRSADDIFTVFNRDEAPPATRPITEGKMGSLLLRLEWSSDRAPLGAVGDLRRDSERSIVDRDNGKRAWADLRTVNTLEIANAGLGSDDGFQFVRLVSDSAAFIRTGGEQGLKLRFRAAGKLGGDALPVQKQESLGGFTALRGYGFKEFGLGDFSLLGTAEYRMEEVSLFVDVGSLRTASGFGDAKAGTGIALNFSDKAHLDFAWRTDGEARWRPEIRLMFHRTY